MALMRLDIPPGIHAEDSETVTGPRYTSGDKVRFRSGKPEKIGGWTKYVTATFQGICRKLLSWFTLTSTKYLAIATHTKLYVENNDTLYDITPFGASTTLGTDPFAITSGSALVVVTHPSHGLVAGDFIIISGVSNPIDGIAMSVSGEYSVTSVIDANSYRITASSNAGATDSATGGGGSGGYSEGGYAAGPYSGSTGSIVVRYLLANGAQNSTSTDTTFTHARTWSLDTWGEDLVANPRGGKIYLWDASVGTGTRAAEITGTPSQNNFILVDSGRHLVSFGSVDPDTSAFDPLLIRWSDSEDFNTWTPDETNEAGTFRLASEGGEIICAAKAENQILVWTDDELFSMQAIEGQAIFGFNKIGSKCGAISPNATVTIGSLAFWMSNHDIFIFDGSVKPLPSTVRTHWLNDFNFTQRFKFFAGFNKENHEIWFFYCKAASQEIDAYIMYNFLEQHWSLGTLVRTAWTDTSPNFNERPLAAGSNGYVYEHEVGYSDDGSSIASSLRTGAIEAVIMRQEGSDRVQTAGDHLIFSNRIVPDFDSLSGSGSFTVHTRRYPHSSEINKGPYTTSSSTEKISYRARGRQLATSWAHTGTGFWRFGTHRMEVQADGER